MQHSRQGALCPALLADHDEWVVPVDVCGVAAMYGTALKARTAYFIS